MKESQISDALRESMNAVRLSPALRARALCAMRGSEERRPKMKRKFSAALAFALVGVLVVAVALAVANRKGVLDFLSYSEATLPEKRRRLCADGYCVGRAGRSACRGARSRLRRPQAVGDGGYQHGRRKAAAYGS